MQALAYDRMSSKNAPKGQPHVIGFNTQDVIGKKARCLEMLRDEVWNDSPLCSHGVVHVRHLFYRVNVFMVLPSGPMTWTMCPCALTMGRATGEMLADHAARR